MVQNNYKTEAFHSTFSQKNFFDSRFQRYLECLPDLLSDD